MRKKSDFLGVFARDEVKNIPNRQCCFIANTDTSNLPGKHWIAVKIINNTAYYFDPFGWIPMRSICKELPVKEVKSTMNRSQEGNMCGPHCVFFLYNNCIAESDKQALSFINNNLK
ncbi:MAG: hypothetical protein GY816_22565 [Cytophagales bacterium]|nr:hypothetical protein [Cytophagales bacterium]